MFSYKVKSGKWCVAGLTRWTLANNPKTPMKDQEIILLTISNRQEMKMKRTTN